MHKKEQSKNKTFDESSDKKKKKLNKMSKEVLKEMYPEHENSESLLNFNENGIHLVNHPDIGVTTADATCKSSAVKVESKGNEVKSVAESEKVSLLNKEKQESCNSSNSHIKEAVKDHLDESESKLTNSQLKAERRAKQEVQRAAKLLAKNNPNVKTENTSSKENKSAPTKEKHASKSSSKSVENIREKSSSKGPVVKEFLHKMKLFFHLPQYKQFDINAVTHPAILEIGFQYNKGIICGSNARCVALLGALKEVIKDFSPGPDKNFCRELQTNIESYLSFLNNCRPLSVSMLNAVKFLKHEIYQMPSEMEIQQIKEVLCDSISNFVKVNILIARDAIGKKVAREILDGDVILVYAFSSLVRDVLCKAYLKKKVFRVIVADSRPKLEGLKMLQCLVKQGLRCSYVSINAVCHVMKEVSKVIIGAHAFTANGRVMSRVGNGQIALVASTYNVPVLVCCESYKYSYHTPTNSIMHNELGDPEDIIVTSLVSNECLKNWRDLPTLLPLNLLYDITFMNLFSLITEEKCSSVPVRVKCFNKSL